MAAEVYDIDDDGYNLHRGETMVVPTGLEAAARYGAEVCPERAIVIQD
jgi:ferredoxin